MPVVRELNAMEILDSRGRPTISVTCTLEDGIKGTASVPSGVSTGTWEALELRDLDPGRYGGLGCRKAVQKVETVIAPAFAGQAFADQPAFDHALLELDGTQDKSSLGANSILGASLAFCRACSNVYGLPLFAYVSELAGCRPRLPRLTVNLFSGGRHAGGQVEIQDVLVTSTAAPTIDAALAMTYAVYQAASELLTTKYNSRLLVADEGGLAPPFAGPEAMLEDAVTAIETAGFRPGEDMHLCVDVASSHFYDGGKYSLGGKSLTSDEMIALMDGWLDRYPILSIEDGLSEDDWANWPVLRERIESRALALGDDLLVTNPARIRRAIAANAANALLLKVNQVGTLTEAFEAFRLARDAGWAVTVSARSGETEDTWLADLAVGLAGDQIKVGSIARSERLAKYNRLLSIEGEHGLPVADWPNLGADLRFERGGRSGR
jgi:enolase